MTPEEAIEKFSNSLDDFKAMSIQEFKELREYVYELRGKKFCEQHQEMLSKIDIFITKVSEWMNTTTEYRKSLYAKIDITNEKMVELPCRERKGWYQSMGSQVRVLWIFVSGIVAAIVIEWIKR